MMRELDTGKTARLVCAIAARTTSDRSGPFSDDPSSTLWNASPKDVGLRWILTCTRCGEQMRIYQTSNAWRARYWGTWTEAD